MTSSSTGATRNSGKRPAEAAGECPERKQQKLDEDIGDDELMELVISRSLKNHQFSKSLIGKLLYHDRNALVDEQLLQILMSRMVDDKFVTFVGNKLEPLLNRKLIADSQFWQKQEELMRNLMQEESNIFGNINLHLASRQIDQSQDIRYILQFNEDLPKKTFAGRKLTIKINISDTKASDCKFSGKVEVFVLDGEFCPDENGRISREEFDKKIQKPRPGKGPLLLGESNNEVVVELKDGVGSAVIQFTDNSKWTRINMFKLGARLHQKEELFGVVQEGLSKAIRVMDRRSEMPEFPELSDDVHCLKNIGKDGPYCRRLREKHIQNVQQFLQALAIDPNGLKKVMCGGQRGLSKTKWEETVEHAKKCDPGSDHHTFIIDEATTLVFNSIFELLGVELNGEYKIISEFPESQKALINDWKKIAFSQKENIKVRNFIENPSEFTDMNQLSSQFSYNDDEAMHFPVEAFLDIEKFDEDMRAAHSKQAVIRWLKLRVGLKFFASLMTFRVAKDERAN